MYLQSTLSHQSRHSHSLQVRRQAAVCRFAAQVVLAVVPREARVVLGAVVLAILTN